MWKLSDDSRGTKKSIYLSENIYNDANVNGIFFMGVYCRGDEDGGDNPIAEAHNHGANVWGDDPLAMNML